MSISQKNFFPQLFVFKYFLILFTLISAIKIYAQDTQWYQFQFRHYSIENGLSQSCVNSILQDKKGFIWIGTGDGLNRFDGYSFKQYKQEPGNPNSLSGSIINDILETPDGKLLLCSDGGGLNIFNPLNPKFVSFKNNPGDKFSISSNRVSAVLPDTLNSYWISTMGGGLNLFDISTNTFQHIRNDKSDFSISNDFIVKMMKSKNGLIYLATRGGLDVINKKRNQIISYKHNDADSSSFANNNLQNVFEDKNGDIWICTYNSGVYKLDKRRKKLTRFKNDETISNSLAGNYVNCGMTDSHGNIWFGTYGNGLSIYDPFTRNFKNIINNFYDRYSLSDNHIQCIFEDNQSLIWIGTCGGGINVYDKSFTNFSSLNHIWYQDQGKISKSKSVYSITADERKNIWFGTDGSGLYKFNLEENSLINYQLNIPFQNSVSGNSIWSLLNFNEEYLYAGTLGQGLNKMDMNSRNFSNYKRDSSNAHSLGSNLILSLFKENDSIIFIGTRRTGMSIFNVNSSYFENFPHDEKNPHSINSNIVYTIYKTRIGEIYVGTQGGGLNLFNRQSNSFDSFSNDANNSSSLSNNDVQCIFEDDRGILWLGTNGGGLNAFDIKTKRFIHFTEKQGLPNNVIYSICSDKKNNLWLSTNNGICRFTSPPQLDFYNLASNKNDNFQTRVFDARDGISANEFNQGACFQDKNGWFFFGNINGITRFHPDSIQNNDFLPLVVFTSFKIFEKEFSLDTIITHKQKITLGYYQSFFSFEFVGLNYLLPEKNQYAYMMEGFDTKWNYSGTRRYASYTNLDPGNYIFKVKASNNDGIWNEKYASVQIVITPPFWKTWWFKSLLVLFFAFVTYTIYRYRIHQIRKEEQKKTAFNKALAEVEMKALRAQMNPHFIFNSLNSINKYIVSKDQDAASDYLARFSRLIRSVLENSMHKEVTLDKDLETLELYMQMERLRFEKRFEYEIKIGDNLETESILIPPLLLQPFVENAIWHGLMPKETAGKILIQIKQVDHSLQCVVEDNGVGREKAAEIKSKKKSGHKSLGMKVTQERIEILKQQKNVESKVAFIDLKDENGNAAGTRAEILIPLEYEY